MYALIDQLMLHPPCGDWPVSPTCIVKHHAYAYTVGCETVMVPEQLHQTGNPKPKKSSLQDFPESPSCVAPRTLTTQRSSATHLAVIASGPSQFSGAIGAGDRELSLDELG